MDDTDAKITLLSTIFRYQSVPHQAEPHQSADEKLTFLNALTTAVYLGTSKLKIPPLISAVVKTNNDFAFTLNQRAGVREARRVPILPNPEKGLVLLEKWENQCLEG